MDDYSLPLSLTSHLLIAPLGVDCKFAVLNKKYIYMIQMSAIGVVCNGNHVERALTSVVTGSGVTVSNIRNCHHAQT